MLFTRLGPRTYCLIVVVALFFCGSLLRTLSSQLDRQYQVHTWYILIIFALLCCFCYWFMFLLLLLFLFLLLAVIIAFVDVFACWQHFLHVAPLLLLLVLVPLFIDTSTIIVVLYALVVVVLALVLLLFGAGTVAFRHWCCCFLALVPSLLCHCVLALCHGGTSSS